MKAAFFVLFALFSAPSFAGPQDTIVDDKAVLHFCPKGAMDCGGASITVKGKNYRAVGNTKSVQDRLDAIIGAHEFHNKRTSNPFRVTGYTAVIVSKGMGWGPPAGTKINIFKITDGLNGVMVPKSMPPRK